MITDEKIRFTNDSKEKNGDKLQKNRKKVLELIKKSLKNINFNGNIFEDFPIKSRDFKKIPVKSIIQ